MNNTINYGRMMQLAMQGLLKDILRRVAKDGLPGQHHFFITFDTTHQDVEMAAWLKERYPEEITIVMQEWFDGLEVLDDHFTVTLNFGNNPEPMVVPFDAIKTFVDPSVEFGLRFDAHDDVSVPSEDEPAVEIFEEVEEEETAEAEIVSLDAFRKPTT